MRSRPFLFLFKAYIPYLLFFSACRFLLIGLTISEIPDNSLLLIPETVARGSLFDVVIINIAFFLPSLVVICCSLLNKYPNGILKFLRIYLLILGALSITSAFSDIGYYQYYGTRLNLGILSWVDTPSAMIKEVFTNPIYLIATIVSIILLYFSDRFFKKMIRDHLGESHIESSIIKRMISGLLILVLLFAGARGSLDFSKKPKDIASSFFSKYPQLNNMTLNGLFNFIHSTPKKDLYLIKVNEASENVKEYFNIDSSFSSSPIARKYEFEKPTIKKNVVVIIVESLSHFVLKTYGKTRGFMPFVDSIANESLFFPNFYSSGVHTHNGIYSTLWGYPAIFVDKPMVESTQNSQQYYGLPQILKENGYETFFFSPGDPVFDNMKSFCSYNGYDHFISQDDFPEEDRLNRYGVPDHILFSKTIHQIDEAYEKKKPFLATYLTISTHPPYDLPSGIDFSPRPTTIDPRGKAYEYSDWAIEHFFKEAATKPWFKETVFAVVADHGQKFFVDYEMPLSYNHCSFFIYDPEKETKQLHSKLAMQVDVFPTLLSYIKQPFVNNTFGVNLLEETRPYAFFSADTKLGIIDSSHFYIDNLTGIDQIYDYKNLSLENLSDQQTDKIKSMREYAFSHLQLSYDMIKRNQVGKPE